MNMNKLNDLKRPCFSYGDSFWGFMANIQFYQEPFDCPVPWANTVDAISFSDLGIELKNSLNNDIQIRPFSLQKRTFEWFPINIQ